jgi:hypothetical protein
MAEATRMRVLELIILLAMLFGIPIAIVWSIVDHVKHGKNRPRRSGSAMGGVLMELDRLTARPSVEHVIEAENLVLRREDDDADGNDPPGAHDGPSHNASQ